jgi:drug/metabolite transporter (DMT)-like permease
MFWRFFEAFANTGMSFLIYLTLFLAPAFLIDYAAEHFPLKGLFAAGCALVCAVCDAWNRRKK